MTITVFITQGPRSRARAFTICFFMLVVALNLSPTKGFYHHPSPLSTTCIGPRRLDPSASASSPASATSFHLATPNSENDKGNHGNGKATNTQNQKQRGVYVRPSAVIERGSGFFFPGLEGPRVRLFAGSALLAVTVINHLLSENTSLFSEALAVLYSLLVLFQGAIEAVKDARVETIAARTADNDNASTSSSTRRQLSQEWNPTSTSPAANNYRDKVEWAAASLLALTPATHMMLLRRQENSNSNDEISSSTLSSPTIDYWLGITTTNTPSDPTIVTSAVASALDTVQASQGGRVALPADHPAVVGILSSNSELQKYRRCVILQQIDNNSCWMVASDDLLASFTKGDLQWLGQLATYVQE